MSAVPISRPNIDTRPRLRVVQGTRASVATQCLNGALAFGLVTLFVFGGSSLAGHVMVEKARRETIRAAQRLQSAKSAQSVLSVQIAKLSDEKDLILWAKRNGFVAPQVAPKPSRNSGALVASR